jgi:hypothetical protein
MTTMRFLLLLLAGGWWACGQQERETATAPDLLACGDEQVFLIDAERSADSAVHYRWQWHVAETKGLPEAYKGLFRTVDECKPVGQGDTLLITASSGGVLLLDRLDKRALFYAKVPNAHSAELLPGNRVAVALSYADLGNSLEIYDLDEPEKRLIRDTLYSGHGAVWVPESALLYALGFDVLNAYRLADWDTNQPRLELVKQWKLPDEGGHDLQSVNENELLISTHHSVWVFDTDDQRFEPFQPLENVPDVKSANYDKETGRLVYTKAEESWWTRHIYMKNPDKVIALPEGFRLYKTRVFPHTE